MRDVTGTGLSKALRGKKITRAEYRDGVCPELQLYFGNGKSLVIRAVCHRINEAVTQRAVYKAGLIGEKR